MHLLSSPRRSFVKSAMLGAALIAFTTTPVLAQGKGNGGGGGGGGTSGPSYTIHKLDDAGGQFLPAYYQPVVDINDVGGVVGSVEAVADGSRYPAFWQVDGGASTLTLLDRGDVGPNGASAISNLNEIIGSGFDGQGVTAIYWASPEATPITLPPLVPGSTYFADGINDDGIICGWVRKPQFDEEGNWLASLDVAVVWRVTSLNGETHVFGPVELPFSGFDFGRATAINAFGSDGLAEVVGVFGNAPGNGGYESTAAGKWLVQAQPDGSVEVIGEAQLLTVASETGDAEAWAINSQGHACGEYSYDVYSEPRKATVWTPEGQFVLADPPTKKGWAPNTEHFAYDLNDSGVIVGETGIGGYPGAIVWTSATTTTPIRLSDSLPKRNSLFTLLWDATAINSAGVIVGSGGTADGERCFVAVPN